MLTCKYTSARLTAIYYFFSLNFNSDNNLHDKEILYAQIQKHFRKIKKEPCLKEVRKSKKRKMECGCLSPAVQRDNPTHLRLLPYLFASVFIR